MRPSSGAAHAARCVAVGLVLAAAPAGAVDLRLLPENPRYARNPTCADVTVVAPARRPGTHPLDDRINPNPALSPMSQGDSAICFAYATADMISQRVGVTVSALDVATRYYFADPAGLERSRDRALRNYLRRHPDLAEEIAESRNDTEASRERNPGRKPYFDKLEDGQEAAAALLYNLGGLCTDRDLPSFDGYGQHARTLSALRWRSRVAAPKISWRSLGGTVPRLRDPATDAFNAGWIAHVERRCRRKPLPVPLIPVSESIADNQLDFMDKAARSEPGLKAGTDRLMEMIDYALDRGRLPVVGYSWYVLEEHLPKEPDIAADHSSPIIARRKAGGRCQYHLQDNTGEYCARMRPGIAERCDLGRVWLDEDELRASLYSVIYLR
ncbi:protein of unknown function; putative exported protein [Methylorubrum extorquens DM4]|uniref:Peptidase C1A papain C-terminal domain-containing protein n=1 Tax=Methylorubrum extorquens (strain DSM 6343 / CIP 106787 / DM4) TaxID=661410 RepID=C7CD12_METED|nr:hypothetical protein [Methylorubrum extorquens]CAX25742.1 protein of unknown function; putative exported protein [Methylorubrum extorquens DM4]